MEGLHRLIGNKLFIGISLLSAVLFACSSRDITGKAVGNGGFIYLNMGVRGLPGSVSQLEQSGMLLNAAIQSTAPGEAQAFHRGLGLIYHITGQNNRSLNAWREADLRPHDLLAWVKRSWAAQDYDDAYLWAQRAIALDPSWAKPYYWSGRVSRNLGSHDEANSSLLRAAELAPQISDVWYELALAQRQDHEWKQALDSLDNARTSAESYGNVGLSNILFEIADIQYSELTPPNTESAFDLFGKAITANSFVEKPWQRADAFYKRAQILAGDSQWSAATVEYGQALMLNPEGYYLRLSYARALLAISERQNAIKILQEAIQFHAVPIEAIILIGDVYYWDGDLETARHYYQWAKELDPTSADAQRRIGEIHENNGGETEH